MKSDTRSVIPFIATLNQAKLTHGPRYRCKTMENMFTQTLVHSVHSRITYKNKNKTKNKKPKTPDYPSTDEWANKCDIAVQ